jgi:hypothetical protein
MPAMGSGVLPEAAMPLLLRSDPQAFKVSMKSIPRLKLIRAAPIKRFGWCLNKTSFLEAVVLAFGSRTRLRSSGTCDTRV